METTDPRGSTETGLTVWRRSYYQLRELERRLVAMARDGEPSDEIDALFQEIEALRVATSELFAAAQVASVSRHVKLFRPGPLLDPQQPQAFSFSGRPVPPAELLYAASEALEPPTCRPRSAGARAANAARASRPGS